MNNTPLATSPIAATGERSFANNDGSPSKNGSGKKEFSIVDAFKELHETMCAKKREEMKRLEEEKKQAAEQQELAPIVSSPRTPLVVYQPPMSRRTRRRLRRQQDKKPLPLIIKFQAKEEEDDDAASVISCYNSTTVYDMQDPDALPPKKETVSYYIHRAVEKAKVSNIPPVCHIRAIRGKFWSSLGYLNSTFQVSLDGAELKLSGREVVEFLEGMLEYGGEDWVFDVKLWSSTDISAHVGAKDIVKELEEAITKKSAPGSLLSVFEMTQESFPLGAIGVGMWSIFKIDDDDDEEYYGWNDKVSGVEI